MFNKKLLCVAAVLALTGCGDKEPYSIMSGGVDSQIFDVRVLGDGIVCIVTAGMAEADFRWYKFGPEGPMDMPLNGDESCNMPEGSKVRVVPPRG